jgi:hypothetical protein
MVIYGLFHKQTTCLASPGYVLGSSSLSASEAPWPLNKYSLLGKWGLEASGETLSEKLTISKRWLGPVPHTCNPSYSGGREQEDGGSKPAWANSLQDPNWTIRNTKKMAGRPGCWAWDEVSFSSLPRERTAEL